MNAIGKHRVEKFSRWVDDFAPILYNMAQNKTSQYKLDGLKRVKLNKKYENQKIAHEAFLHNNRELSLRVIAFLNIKLWKKGSKIRESK